jgi:hypothetical protein
MEGKSAAEKEKHVGARSGDGSATDVDGRPRGKRGVCSRGQWGKNGGKKRGIGGCGARFKGVGGMEQRRGAARGCANRRGGGGGAWGGGQHGGRATRLVGNGPRPVAAGGTARPCRAVGPNRGGGGRLTDGVGWHRPVGAG